MNQQKTYVKDQGIKEMFFKSEGRINRLRFFKRTIVVALFSAFLMIILGAIFGPEIDLNKPPSPNDPVDPSLAFIYLAVSIFALIPYYFLYVRRLHDLNMNNNLAIVVTVAGFIGIFTGDDVNNASMISVLATLATGFITLYLIFADGTHGTNFYGPDPLGRDN